jgi:signal transduction histidine kinase
MRRRILLLVVGMTTLVVLAFAIPLIFLIRSAVQHNVEQHANDEANSIAHYILSADPTDAQITSFLSSFSQTSDRAAGVVTPDRTRLGTIPHPDQNVPPPLPASSVTPTAATPPYGSPGFPENGQQPQQRPRQVPAVGGQIAEVSVPTGSGTYQVLVFTSHAALTAGQGGWLLLLAGGSVTLLLIGVVGGEVVTRRITRPLLDTARTANALSTGDVTARAPTDGPREVAEVGTALNRLADRIDDLIAAERETVADMSHRLRTPLTALRLDAESLRNHDDAELIGEHVSSLERTLTAIIRAARRPQREGRMPACDATAVVGERVTFWSALTEDQGRIATVSLPTEALVVRCSAEDLGAAVDALLENVVAHTPEETAFAVKLDATPAGARLEVSDDGPGLTEGAGERGRSDRGSSGLGLSIARQVAEASGGSMLIGVSAQGGASIVLELNRA